MGDVAQASTDRQGRPVVAFNPAACARLGPEMCEFVRAHEYGHIAMGHLYDGTPDRQAEAEADCWAAKNASPAAVRAAANYFNKGYFGSSIHGSGPQRARRVAGCQSGANKVSVRRARPAVGRTVSTRSSSSGAVRTFSTSPSTARRSVRTVRRPTTARPVRAVSTRPSTSRTVRTVSQRPPIARTVSPRPTTSSVVRTVSPRPTTQRVVRTVSPKPAQAVRVVRSR